MASDKKQIKRSVNFNLFLKFIFHSVCVLSLGSIHNVYELYFESFEKIQEDETGTLWMYKTYFVFYSTIWNVLFQTIFLFLALAHDVLEWASKQESTLAKRIRYWRDVLFAAMVVPYTCFVFSMFWTLYAIDRELVFPKVYDVVVPWWFNHCVHTNILAMIIVEAILQPRRYPTNRKLELILNATVGILYAIVYYSIYFFAGRWLYNVFGIMTWWQVCLFQVLIWSSSFIFYEIQWPINRLIHGKDPEPQKEQTSTKNISMNGEKPIGEMREVNETKKNGEAAQNVEVKQNGETNTDGVQITNVDFKAPPFSTKSWSLKYRTIRNQFENSKL